MAHRHPSFPSLSAHQAPDSWRALTSGLKSVYLPLHWKTPHPPPPIRNHLSIDAVAHKTIPFTSGLSRMPMINSHLVSPALAIPAQFQMDNTYSTLKQKVREALLEEWARLFPAPGSVHHSATVNPQPFMGLGTFMAWRIHQMRAGKRELAAHTTWRTLDAHTSCPRCALEPETFQHAVLACPSRQSASTRLLHIVMSLGHEAPLWSSLPLLERLATYISVTSPGFPPTMFLPTTPPSSPPLPLSTISVPVPAFRVFSFGEV